LIHELSAIQNICQSGAKSHMEIWESFRQRLEDEAGLRREDFVRELMVLSGNRLSLKIWFLLQQYSGNPYKGTVQEAEKDQLEQILAAIRQQDAEKAASGFKSWNEWLIKERMRNDS
jgi:GntR family transcriptional repressor for pyruvate dehydrogenase complex